MANETAAQMEPGFRRGRCNIPTCLCLSLPELPDEDGTSNPVCSTPNCGHHLSLHHPLHSFVTERWQVPIGLPPSASTQQPISQPEARLGPLPRFEHLPPTFVPPNRSILPVVPLHLQQGVNIQPLAPTLNSLQTGSISGSIRTTSTRQRALAEIQRGRPTQPQSRRRQGRHTAAVPAPDITMRFTILRLPDLNPFLANGSHAQYRLQSRRLVQVLVDLSPDDTAEEVREKVMTRIAAISLELQTLMIGYKLWAVRGRQRDYRVAICSAGQTETLLFIRENTANPHVLFYISPRDTPLSWEFIHSLPEIPDAERYRLEFDRAWRGWEQEKGLDITGDNGRNSEPRQSNIQSPDTRAATLRAPSTSPTPAEQIALSPERLRTTPSIESTPSITSRPPIYQLEELPTSVTLRETTSGVIPLDPLQGIRVAMKDHWLPSELDRVDEPEMVLDFSELENMWPHQMVVALSDIQYSQMLPYPRVRSPHSRYRTGADFGGVFRAFFTEWLETEASRLCPGSESGAQLPPEDLPTNSSFAMRRKSQMGCWETLGKVIGCAVLHLGFAAWPRALDPAILVMAIARQRDVQYSPDTAYFDPNHLLRSVLHKLDEWIQINEHAYDAEIGDRLVQIVASVFNVADEESRQVLENCTTAYTCTELAYQLYWEFEWSKREGVLDAFTKGLNWSEAVNLMQGLATLNLADLHAFLRGFSFPSGEAILEAIDFKVSPAGQNPDHPLGNSNSSEHMHLRDLFSAWICRATPMQRRWFISSTTGGSNLDGCLTIKTAKDNRDPVYENMQGLLLVFRTCEKTAVFAWEVLTTHSTVDGFAEFMAWQAQGDGPPDFNTV
jgi:hypothetical protein